MSAEFSTRWPPEDPGAASTRVATHFHEHIEEAAILFSSGQVTAARERLTTAIAVSGADKQEQLAWRMLLELHEAEGEQSAFEQRALAYAQRFETSPPPWQHAAIMSVQLTSEKLPVLSLRGKLATDCLPALHQLFRLGCQHQRFRLEFASITEVDIAGCRALLQTLDAWQQQVCDVYLHKVDTLTEKIRTLVQPGRRDPDDAAWRLLMELLWQSHASDDYEAVCLDYSITYEVSPPTPRSAPTAHQETNNGLSDQAFAMPAIIETPIDLLLAEIDAHANLHERIVLDGLGLRRVDFNAAAPLLTHLSRLATTKPVELRHTSFLVSVLLQLVGGHSQLKIINRKT